MCISGLQNIVCVYLKPTSEWTVELGNKHSSVKLALPFQNHCTETADTLKY